MLRTRIRRATIEGLARELSLKSEPYFSDVLYDVSFQAVSRWENGETVPNTETLKLLSKEFNVTINTILGAPKQLICQCCGMPLEDEIVGHDRDGFFNEDYCKWCYADGTYTYSNMNDLINVCVNHLVKERFY